MWRKKEATVDTEDRAEMAKLLEIHAQIKLDATLCGLHYEKRRKVILCDNRQSLLQYFKIQNMALWNECHY